MNIYITIEKTYSHKMFMKKKKIRTQLFKYRSTHEKNRFHVSPATQRQGLEEAPAFGLPY